MAEAGQMLAAFLAELRDEQVAQTANAAADAVLQEMWTAAREAWPESHVPAAALARAAGARIDEGPGPVESLRALNAADLYLVLGCLAQERPALEGFEHTLLTLRPTLARAGASDAAIDEVFGRLRARLLVADSGRQPKVAQYGARAKLASWLRVVALREVQALSKSDRHADLDDDAALEELLVSRRDPELESLRHRFRGEFRNAFGSALQGLSPKQRTVLRLHLLDKLSVDRIAGLHDVHRATAARWLVGIRDQLYAETQEQFLQTLGLDSREFKSMMGLVLSQLTYSIGRDLS